MSSDVVDPIAIMRKAAALQQAIAKKELAKGSRANLQKAAEASMAAASLAKDIAFAEHRAGINNSQGERITGIEVELRYPEQPAHIVATYQDNERLQQEVQRLTRRIWELEQPGARAGLPNDPMLTQQPTPGSNVVPMQRQANAAPQLSPEEVIKQRRRAAGDVVDTGWQRSAFDGGLGGLYRDGPGVAWQSGDLPSRDSRGKG